MTSTQSQDDSDNESVIVDLVPSKKMTEAQFSTLRRDLLFFIKYFKLSEKSFKKLIKRTKEGKQNSVDKKFFSALEKMQKTEMSKQDLINNVLILCTDDVIQYWFSIRNPFSVRPKKQFTTDNNKIEGRFSHEEDLNVKLTTDSFIKRHGLEVESLGWILRKRKVKTYNGRTLTQRELDIRKEYWAEIESSFPDRTVRSIFYHVNRVCNPDFTNGKFSEFDDNIIRQMLKNNSDWTEMGEVLGRFSSNVRDRFRRDLKGNYKKGKWEPEEDYRLLSILRDLHKDGLTGTEMMWVTVSERMKDRAEKSCRARWVERLRHKFLNNMNNPIFTYHDEKMLLDRLWNSSFMCETQIKWSTLPTEEWNLWTGAYLNRAFNIMKKRVPMHWKYTFTDLLEMLKKEVDQIPNENLYYKSTASDELTQHQLDHFVNEDNDGEGAEDSSEDSSKDSSEDSDSTDTSSD